MNYETSIEKIGCVGYFLTNILEEWK